MTKSIEITLFALAKLIAGFLQIRAREFTPVTPPLIDGTCSCIREIKIDAILRLRLNFLLKGQHAYKGWM